MKLGSKIYAMQWSKFYWLNLIEFCRNHNGKLPWMMRGWILLEGDFKKTTKKLRMVWCQLKNFCCHGICSIYCGFLYTDWLLSALVYFCFVKPKSKGQFRWWIFMRFPNQGMASLAGIKVAAAFRGGITVDLPFFCTIKLLAICCVFLMRGLPGKRLVNLQLHYLLSSKAAI